MKLEVKENKKGNYRVLCPRISKKVDPKHSCNSCEWLSVITAESVKCRWTQEKEDLLTGRRYYVPT